MLKLSRAALAFLVIGCLLGSSFIFDIRVEGLNSGAPGFILEKTLPAADKELPIDLRSFWVVAKRNGRWDHPNPVWAFEFSHDFVKIKKINYGEVPHGATEKKSAEALVSGAEYLAIGMGAGSGGQVEFTMP